MATNVVRKGSIYCYIQMLLNKFYMYECFGIQSVCNVIYIEVFSYVICKIDIFVCKQYLDNLTS